MAPCEQTTQRLAVAGDTIAVAGSYTEDFSVCRPGTPTGSVFVIDAADGSLLHELPGRQVIGHGEHFVVTDSTRTIRIVDGRTGALVRSLGSVAGAFPDSGLTAVAMSGEEIVATESTRLDGGEGLSAIDLIDATSGTRRLSIFVLGDFDAIAASADVIVIGDVAYGERRSRVEAYDAKTGVRRWRRDAPDEAGNARFGAAVALLDDDVVVGAPHGNGTVYILDGATGTVQRTIQFPHAGYRGNDFGRSLAVGGGLIVVTDPAADGNRSGSGDFYGFDAHSGALVLPAYETPASGDERLGYWRVALLGERIVTLGIDWDHRFNVQVFAPRCGDGIVEPCEPCDDGNRMDGDGCSSQCLSDDCGDGTVDAGELCDDGNRVDGDGCDANCRPTGCGNCRTDPTEECDDGNLLTCDACDPNCTMARCGNGIIADPATCSSANENCDDGNLASGDGCDDRCELEAPTTTTSTVTVTTTTSTSTTLLTTTTTTRTSTTTSTSLSPSCGPAPCPCDDGDSCTADLATETGCHHRPLTGLASTGCAIVETWGADCGDVPAVIAYRLTRATALLADADAAGTPRARRAALRAARRALGQAARTGARAVRSGHADDACVRTLIVSARALRHALRPELRRTIRRPS